MAQGLGPGLGQQVLLPLVWDGSGVEAGDMFPTQPCSLHSSGLNPPPPWAMGGYSCLWLACETAEFCIVFFLLMQNDWIGVSVCQEGECPCGTAKAGRSRESWSANQYIEQLVYPAKMKYWLMETFAHEFLNIQSLTQRREWGWVISHNCWGSIPIFSYVFIIANLKSSMIIHCFIFFLIPSIINLC